MTHCTTSSVIVEYMANDKPHKAVLNILKEQFPRIETKTALAKPLMAVLSKELKHISFDELFQEVPVKPVGTEYQDNKANNCLGWKIARFINQCYGHKHLHANRKIWTKYRNLLHELYDKEAKHWTNAPAVMYSTTMDVWAFRSPYSREANTESKKVLKQKLAVNTRIKIENVDNMIAGLEIGDPIDDAILVMISTGLRCAEVLGYCTIHDQGDGIIGCKSLCKKKEKDYNERRPLVLYDFKTVSTCMDNAKAEVQYKSYKSVYDRITRRLRKLMGSRDYTPHQLRSMYAKISYMACPMADTEIEHIRLALNHLDIASSLHYNKTILE